MRISRLVLFFAALALPGADAAAAADVVSPTLGTPVSQNEIDRWSITIFPDGRNLPAGSGNARDGAVLYNAGCAACHGAGGKEGQIRHAADVGQQAAESVTQAQHVQHRISQIAQNGRDRELFPHQIVALPHRDEAPGQLGALHEGT